MLSEIIYRKMIKTKIKWMNKHVIVVKVYLLYSLFKLKWPQKRLDRNIFIFICCKRRNRL